MNKIENENNILKGQNELINQIKINIIDTINNSCFELTKSIPLKKEDVEQWKNLILNNINKEIGKLIEFILTNKEKAKIDEINNKKENKIENEIELYTFTPKDIQEENKEITRNFQNETYNNINVNEKIENENVALFLKDVAKISRISYIEATKIFKIMKQKFCDVKMKKIDNESSGKEFSSWVKIFEKENKTKEYKNILNQVKLFEKDENKINKEYLLELFYDLTIMYFHCTISFPLVEINFKKEDNFDSDKMIDFINRGKNRKVNFVILPSLFSNGIYLQNGKSWVFTFTKKTFKFEDSIQDNLNKLLKQDNLKQDNLKKDNLVLENLKNNLKIKFNYEKKNNEKYVIVLTNLEIPENIQYKFIFYLRNKENNKIISLKTKKNRIKIDKNYEIKDFKFKLENETIIFSPINK